jgi:hypothetical protein
VVLNLTTSLTPTYGLCHISVSCLDKPSRLLLSLSCLDKPAMFIALAQQPCAQAILWGGGGWGEETLNLHAYQSNQLSLH